MDYFQGFHFTVFFFNIYYYFFKIIKRVSINDNNHVLLSLTREKEKLFSMFGTVDENTKAVEVKI
jgi:hypothetical protein